MAFDKTIRGAVKSAVHTPYFSIPYSSWGQRMRITVKLFALMREKVGTDTIHLELPDHADIVQALTVLQCQHPSLAPYLDNSRFALQMEFVSPDTTLQAGDELALIPPVSGGI